MISSVTGVVQRITSESMLVRVGGVGLRIFVSRSVQEDVESAGQHVTLQTHLHWRENDIALYGFSSEEERDLFELLLGVSGIGPRLALAVISTLSPEILISAVAREETQVLERVPGIGKKTAQRVMFHLRDKLRADLMAPGAVMLSDVDADVIDALTALGYSVVEAQGAVQRLSKEAPDELEERVRLALRGMGG